MIEYKIAETLFKVTDVSLSFDGLQILKPTSLEVKNIIRPGMFQGQIVGLLGPSGVGKTQISRIICGLQKPDSGRVEVSVNGKLTPTSPGLIGFVEQNYPLFRHRTVMGNLMVALKKSKLSKKERKEKALGMLAEFELDNKQNNYPSQLSGGQRQRIAIIRELLSSEHFLVLDEPFTGLDPLMKDVTCDLIKHVANLKEANTMFVVAHDIGALVQISDTLWLFGRERDENGNIIQGATIKKTYNLIERELAWQENIERTSRFSDFCREVKEEFKHL